VWSNTTTSTNTGNVYGPGFFFESGIGGGANPLNAGDDWGDQGNCVWTFCVNVTIGTTIGAPVNFSALPLDDNVAGSWAGGNVSPCPPPPLVQAFQNVTICQPCPTYTLQPLTDSLICYNENQVFSILDTSNLTFTWSLQPQNVIFIGDTITIPYQNSLTANLSVFGTDINGCETDTVDIDLLFLPNISNIIGPTEFCDTTQNELYYITTPDSLYSFTWSYNGLLYNGDSVYVDFLGYLNSNLVVTGSNYNCVVDTFLNINVKQPPPLITLEPICYGFPNQLVLLGADTVTWSGSYVNNDVLTPPRGGIYTLNYVINVDTCSYNDVTYILVRDNPLLLSISDIDSQMVELCSDHQKNFIYNIIGDEDVNYTWELFKDGRLIRRGSQPTFQYYYDKTGLYELNVVTEKDGCLSDASLMIHVDQCRYSALFVPNSFSPNNDGLNDLFKPVGLNIKDLNILIFNRWGEKIYEANDLSGWDGTYNGVNSPQGVYIYQIVYRDLDNHPQYLVGNITLYR